ncbi:phosphoribosylglycinamide formyltransferase [Pullulanibacillus sp. KACC 23026]|uniref:phosphoribosylglycinamide formyltransferase n=1 Tax=Pullulanibacillus sp. KACC 23026 TaxID=3028315 RepID=UPI0023AF5A8B|nr:phosphoribosylglycinamide formyltransferase [Pullulanibacillus sp. KACC 23026]WEG12392.1 phosphoribosylglycinamide formyltransferase [Pullulanibacillus sp. KACC 23026]
MRLAVFASGTGSNFQALVQAVRSGELAASIDLLVCDRPGAAVIEKAKLARVETLVLSPKNFENKQAYETKLLESLRSKQIDLVVLAGYMRLVGPTLLGEYKERILNIHPSLLPAFPGLHAIEKAYEVKVPETGVTVHLVDEGMDTGPILAQESLTLLSNESLEGLEARIHEVEHRLYPKTVQRYILQLSQMPNR